MANKRMIYSDLFEDDFLSGLDLFGRYLWIGLIGAVMDDQGRSIDNAAIIRARVFPYDQVDDAQVEAVISTLASAGKVLRYTVNGKKLIQIVNWWRFQQPSWAAESKFPAPDGWTDRVKVHVKGNKILTVNWDQEGGFTKLHSPVPANQSDQLPSDLHSPLPSDLPSDLHSRIEEYEVKVKSEIENESEGEVEVEGAQKPAAAAALARPVIFAIYEREIGPLTPMIGDQLQEFERDYPPEWFEMAVREAITHNKRNLAYVAAILKRWKVDGPVGLRAAVPKGDGSPGVASPLKEKNDAIIADLLRGLEQ